MPIGMLGIYRLQFVCLSVCLSVSKIFCNEYIRHVSTQGDEIWQHGRHEWVAGHLPFWWTLAQGLAQRSKVKSFGNAHLVDRLRDQAEILQGGEEAPAAGLCRVWHHQIWPWMTLRCQKSRSYFLTWIVKYVKNGNSYDVGPNRYYIDCQWASLWITLKSYRSRSHSFVSRYLENGHIYEVIIIIIIIIILHLFQQLTIRNFFTISCPAGQHRYNRTQRTNYNTTKHNNTD